MTDIELRLNADVNSAVRNVGSFRGEWQKLVKEVEKPLRQVNSLRALEDELDKGKRASERARDGLRDLGNELARTVSPSKELQLSYRAATAELQKMERAEVQQRVRLASMRAELQGAGIDTRNLAVEQQRLRAELAQRLSSGTADASITQARSALGVGNIQASQQALAQLRQQYQLLVRDGNLSSKELAEAQATYRASVEATLDKLRQLRAAAAAPQWKAAVSIQNDLAASFGKISDARDAFGITAIKDQQRELAALRSQYTLLKDSGVLSSRELSIAQANYRESVSKTLEKLRDLRSAAAAPVVVEDPSIRINQALGNLGIERLRQLQAQLQSLPADYDRLAKAGFRSAQEQAAAQAQLQRQLGETRDAIKEISSADQGGGALGFIGKLGAASVVGYSLTSLVGQYVRSADGLRKMNGQLRLATEGQEEFNAAQRALGHQADDYQAPLNGLYQLYSRLSPALRDANKGQVELLGVTEAVTASMKISAATAEESENSIIQFAQALGAGAFRGDEFNSVAEQSPRLMRALAEGLGVSRSALKGMADAGQLTTTVVVNGLLKALPKLREEAAKMPKTLDGSLTGLKNQATEAVGAFDNLTNFTARLTEQVSGLASPLKKASDYLKAFNQKGFKGAIELFDANSLADQAKFAQDRIGAVQKALEELRASGRVSRASRISLGTGDRSELEAQLAMYQAQLAKIKAAQDESVRQQEGSTKSLERTYDERSLALADSFELQVAETEQAAAASKEADEKSVSSRESYLQQLELLDREQSDSRARRLAKEEAAAQAENGVHLDEIDLLKKYVAQTGSTWDDYLKRQQERQRLELASEKSWLDRRKSARAQATVDLTSELARQTDALKLAQQNAEQINAQTTDVLQPFKDALKRPTVAAAGADYGTAGAYKANASQALQQGNTAAALREAQKALDVIQQIEQAGGNAYGLQGFKQQLLDIATGAQELEKVRAADAVNRIQQSIADLQKQLDLVKIVDIGFQLSEETVAQLTQRIKDLAASLSKSMIIQPTIIGPSGTPVIAPTGVAPGTITTDPLTPSFDVGGYTGPGGKYEPAGVVHRGEHVQPQEVVREPGALGFLERIRQYGYQNTIRSLRAGWRGYAAGGLVAARMVPSIPSLSADAPSAMSGSSNSLTPLNLYVGDRQYAMMAPPDTTKQIRRESLKGGHRRPR